MDLASSSTASSTPHSSNSDSDNGERRWQPLSPRQRRVVGVLIEKAKTTPDSYPLTLNSLVSGCNQKSNRAPQMELTAEQVADVLDELRALEAVVEVHGDGRVAKFKHCMYQWLGVDKVQLAVMGELLLRGEQTVGDLRQRASRMEAIESVAALQPILKELMDAGLVVSLTPAGRGQVVTHGLYPESEKANIGQACQAPSSTPSTSPSPQPHQSVSPGNSEGELQQLRLEVGELKTALAALASRVEQLEQRD